MFKKIIATLVLLCSCVLLTPCFESRASNYKEFSILSDRPTTNEYTGYMEVYGVRNSDGYECVKVIRWRVELFNIQGTPYVNMYVNSNGTISFAFGAAEYYTISYISSDGMDTWEKANEGAWGTNSQPIYPTIMSGYTIKAYRVYGNVASATDNLQGYNQNGFIVKYNAENIIVDEQKESNSWLEKIFDAINGNQEQEKQEAQTQGNSSVSQGSDAIQDSGVGFSDSLGGLVSSMSYSGTECSWTFPEVRLPAISGVMDETVLIEEQPIDFGMWIDAIPSNILLLIRSVLTGALIIYCFKELYGTISYVLTLKGSGVNE